MRFTRKITDIKKFTQDSKNHSIGFVPTMGALHEGHVALVARSVKENRSTVVSIFVNPTQFGPKEDYSTYPRNLAHDAQKLRELKVKILFAPRTNSMYPDGNVTKVSVSGLTRLLCGSPTSRGPQHFDGVALVVAKLFNLVRPDRAYFGLKDFQQLRVIEQMNKDLNLGVKIIRCPTVREKNGLALSSRNVYLSPSQRQQAPKLYRALQLGRKLLRSRPRLRPSQVRHKVKSLLKSIPQSRIDYVELVNPNTLQKVTHTKGPMLLAAGLWLGHTRLIDNVQVN